MTDREIFRDNLNFYLQKNNVMQKDLAEYVGATSATVSGWTRGVSYPRVDTMEKIALFFGVPTSAITGLREDIAEGYEEKPKNDEVKLLIKGLNKLTPEQLEQATAMFKVMFAPQYNELFTKENEHDS